MVPGPCSDAAGIVARPFVHFDGQDLPRLTTVDRLFEAQGFEFLSLVRCLSGCVNITRSSTLSVIGSRLQDVSNHALCILSEPPVVLSIPPTLSFTTNSAFSHPAVQTVRLRPASTSGHPSTPGTSRSRLNSHSASNLPQLQPITLTPEQTNHLHTQARVFKPVSRNTFDPSRDPSHSALGFNNLSCRQLYPEDGTYTICQHLHGLGFPIVLPLTLRSSVDSFGPALPTNHTPNSPNDRYNYD